MGYVSFLEGRLRTASHFRIFFGNEGSQVQSGAAQNQGSEWELNVLKSYWNLKHPFTNGCFNWMIPNHYTKSACFTKHPFEFWLFRVPGYWLLVSNFKFRRSETWMSEEEMVSGGRRNMVENTDTPNEKKNP